MFGSPNSATISSRNLCLVLIADMTSRVFACTIPNECSSPCVPKTHTMKEKKQASNSSHICKIAGTLHVSIVDDASTIPYFFFYTLYQWSLLIQVLPKNFKHCNTMFVLFVLLVQKNLFLVVFSAWIGSDESFYTTCGRRGIFTFVTCIEVSALFWTNSFLPAKAASWTIAKDISDMLMFEFFSLNHSPLE